MSEPRDDERRGSVMSDPTPSRWKVWRIVAAIVIVGSLALAWLHARR